VKKILMAASAMMLGVSGAWAAGTAAGTPINNTASLTYSAGGVDQTDNGNHPVNSNQDSFVVDKKIDFTLTNDDGDQVSTNVVPGAQDINTTWTLANTGNMDQNFTLASDNLTGNETIYNDADTQNTGTQNIYYSADGGANWHPYTTQIEIAADHNISVRVASDIPSSVSNGDVMNIKLTATAVKSDGSTETDTGGAGGVDRPDVMDTVRAEDDRTTDQGDESNTNYNATTIRFGGYIVTTAVLDATKTSCVIWDPVNVGTNPKRIPGAVVRYAIDVNNTGSADATDVTLTDNVPNHTTYGVGTSGLTQVARIVTEACNCTNPGSSNGDGINESGGTITANYNTVTHGTHECAYFDVTVD